MKKGFCLFLVLALLFGCLNSFAEETEDMRTFYNPNDYDLLYVSDIFTLEDDSQVLQATFGTINMDKGEDDIEFIGFDPNNVATLVFADGAVIEMPVDPLYPEAENIPVGSFEELESWFNTLQEAFDEPMGFWATFEMNENGELTALRYLYLP